MTSGHWTDRLSEYLDGELSAADAARADAHLERCPECRDTLEALRAVVARARALERPSPPRDLWPGIAARIREPGPPVERAGRLSGRGVRPGRERRSGEADSGSGSSAAAARRAGGARGLRDRRFSLTLPQLAAAAIALVLLSGGAVWTLAGGGTAGPAGVRSVAGGPEAAPDPVATLTSAPGEPGPSVARYEAAIAELQRALFYGGASLDSATVRKLRASLATIDRAIEEARRALDEDPGDTYLHHHLADTMQRKVRFLRETTALLAVQG